jgi:uncharacterized OsmC-like protein
MTIELSRRSERYPLDTSPLGLELSRTTRIDVKIHFGTTLSEQQREKILEAADSCHITKSIREGMEIICSLAEAQGE